MNIKDLKNGAINAIIAHRNAPFPTQVGDTFRWTGEDYWERRN